MDLRRPEVTVTDPRQPGVLTPAEEPPPLHLGRRGAALLAAAAVVGATALVGADALRDRREAVEQRRLDGAVDVALAGGPASWSVEHDPSAGTGTVRALVRLANRGARPVRVTSAQLGGLRAADAVPLPAGGGGRLVLTRTVRCPVDGSPPPPQPQARELQLRLQTPAGPRQVVLVGDGLSTAVLDDSVQRACLFPPLGESVRLSGTVVRTEDRVAVALVELANVGRVPVRLLSLVPARGLVVESVRGDATGLPLVLPARTGAGPLVRTLQVRLAVVCGALLGADLLRPFEEVSAIVEDVDRTQMTSVAVLARDPDLRLRQLAGRACSSG